jgi:hypothetical protein
MPSGFHYIWGPQEVRQHFLGLNGVRPKKRRRV